MLGKNTRQYLVPLFIWLAAVVAILWSGKWKNEAMPGLIHADAQGYYGYLVAGFLQQSFDWEQVLGSYAHYHGGTPADFTRQTEFGRIDKYYAGTAVLMLPFFLLAWAAALIWGFPVDGYSLPFHLGILAAALFYAAVGMVFLVRFLRAKGIDNGIAWLVALTCFFGTDLFHYSASEPGMSHAYSFALVSVFMYLTVQVAEKGGTGRFLMAAAVFGLIVLGRPTNGLVLLAVPFLVGTPQRLAEAARSYGAKTWAMAAVVTVAIMGIQSLLYYLQVGRPVVWAYEGETFDFTKPEIMNVLFSYRKGLYVYTPWAFIGTIGLFALAWKRHYEGLGLLAFLLVNVYVISSWWSWYYGSSLGMRAMIEYLPFFGYGAAFLMQSMTRPMRILVAVLMLATVPVNLIQSYQYQKFILHWDQMDKERFWKIFLKTDRKYDGIFYRQAKVIAFPAEETVADRKVFGTDLEEGMTWGEQGLTEERASSGKRSSKIMKGASFGTTLGVPIKELGPEGNRMLYISAMVWTEQALPNLTLAYSYRAADGDYGHTYLPIGDQVTEPGQWFKVEELVPMEAIRSMDHSWIVYPYSEADGPVYVDDLHYEVITLK